MERISFKYFILGLGCIFIAMFFYFFAVPSSLRNAVLEWDKSVLSALRLYRTDAGVSVFLWATLLGEPLVVVLAGIFAALVLAFWKRHAEIAWVWASLGLAGMVIFIGKWIVRRPRPGAGLTYYYLDSFSFPSGHAAAAVAFYGMLVYILWKTVKNRLIRADAFMAGLLVIGAVAFSRMYLGVHYLLDILAGLCVGCLILLFSAGIFPFTGLAKAMESVISKLNPFDYSREKALWGSGIACAVFAILFVLWGIYWTG